MAFIIYFVGFIAHLRYPYNTGVRNVAALIFEQHHLPRLVVTNATNAVAYATFPETDYNTAKNIKYYDLSGSGRITIENIAAGAVSWSTLFRDEVKGLQGATGKTDLKTDVQSGLSSAVYAFIELRGGGYLDVAGYYRYDSEYDGVETPCVPSRTSFTATTKSGGLIRLVADSGKEIVIDVTKNPTITIANVPAKAMSGHFKYYANLMDGGNPANTKAWADPAQPQPCTKSPIFNPLDLDVSKADTADCTNTHFP